MNSEFRFPLIDVLAMPFLQFGASAGASSWTSAARGSTTSPSSSGEDGRLKDGHASYGAGFSVYFLGLPWNVDFAKQWDFQHSLSAWQTTFYIGMTF